MIRTVAAVVDEQGRVRLLEAIAVSGVRRALATILEKPPADAYETALLSEAALVEEWNRPEEAVAWSPLQPERQCLSCSLILQR